MEKRAIIKKKQSVRRLAYSNDAAACIISQKYVKITEGTYERKFVFGRAPERNGALAKLTVRHVYSLRFIFACRRLLERQTGKKGYCEQILSHGNIPQADYEALMSDFRIPHFDAELIAETAKKQACVIW